MSKMTHTPEHMHTPERCSVDLHQIPTRPAAHRARRGCVRRNAQSGGGSRLIIPGQNTPGNSNARLVVPGGNNSGSTAAPTRQKFRPPPGFMEEGFDRNKPDKAKLSNEDMLNRLRSGHGHWYDQALYVPLLADAGYDAATLENETGLERPRQNVWIVAAQVHASLAKSDMDRKALKYFDVDDADLLLYELRFLDLETRPAAATYVAEKELSTPETNVLSRAIREHARRQGQHEGFSTSPGDCLAYKYFRDAIETRRESDKQSCLARAMAVAETEAATKAIAALKEEKPIELSSSTPIALTMQVVRMTGEEMSFRPVALAGALEEVSPAALAATPQTRQTGAFHAFEALGEPGQKWVVMPAWHALMVSRKPVALYVSNCQHVPAIVAASRPRTDEDRMKLAGPAMLLADTDKVEEIEPQDHYLVAVTGSHLGIASGADLAPDARVCARILLCCRPATRSNMPMGADDSAIMQL